MTTTEILSDKYYEPNSFFLKDKHRIRESYYELISLQQFFIKTNSIPKEYSLKWPINKLSWWSRPVEYHYILNNIIADKYRFKKNALEIGPGISFLTDIIIHNVADLSVYDTDISVRNFWNSKGVNTVNDLHGENKYDYIYSVSVLEHTVNPIDIIELLYHKLKPNGKLMCTFDISNDVSYSSINPDILDIIINKYSLIKQYSMHEYHLKPKGSWYNDVYLNNNPIRKIKSFLNPIYPDIKVFKFLIIKDH